MNQDAQLKMPHVAVNLSNIPEEEGGGHVFEEYVAQAVCERLESRGWQVTLIVLNKEVAVSGWRSKFSSSVNINAPDLRKKMNPPPRLRPGVILPGRGLIGRLRERFLKSLSFRLFGRDDRYIQLSEAEMTNHRSRVLAAELRALGIDLMYAPSPNILTIDIPYVLTVWDLQHRLQPWFPEVTENNTWKMREESCWRSLSRASGIICGTERGCKEVSNLYNYPEDNLHVIPMPCPPMEGASRPKNLPLHVESQGYIFYPAQFWKHKNHILIIEAMASLKQRGEKMVHVVFTGSKSPRATRSNPDYGSFAICESRAHELGISDHVHWLGFVSRPELSYLYDHAMALTFVSWFGPDNLPPLEAFSRGCPVIAADVPGARQQLKDACQYIDPASIESLRDALVKLDTTPDMVTDMVQKGKRIVAERTGADYARAVEGILGSIMPDCLRTGSLKLSNPEEQPRT